MELLIANKNYSSWSMRPWLVLRYFGLPFDERTVWLGEADTEQAIRRDSPSGRVPCLIDGEQVIWDSLAICETLAERYPQLPLWPRDAAQRARARAICAEMHSGFQGLRESMWMNLHASGFAGQGATPAALADIARIETIFQSCLLASGGPFLFGDFSIADAMYAPVVMRFNIYRPALSATTMAYCERITALPDVQDWIAQAGDEGHRIARYEART